MGLACGDNIKAGFCFVEIKEVKNDLEVYEKRLLGADTQYLLKYFPYIVAVSRNDMGDGKMELGRVRHILRRPPHFQCYRGAHMAHL